MRSRVSVNGHHAGRPSMLSSEQQSELLALASCGVNGPALARFYMVSKASISYCMGKARKSITIPAALPAKAKLLENAIRQFGQFGGDAQELLEEKVLLPFLENIPLAFSPYAKVIERMMPGTVKMVVEQASAFVRQAANSQLLNWVWKSEFESADAVKAVESEALRLYAFFTDCLIPESAKRNIDGWILQLSEIKATVGGSQSALGFIMEEYFFGGRTMEAIGDEFNVSRQRIDELVSNGCERLPGFGKEFAISLEASVRTASTLAYQRGNGKKPDPGIIFLKSGSPPFAELNSEVSMVNNRTGGIINLEELRANYVPLKDFYKRVFTRRVLDVLQEGKSISIEGASEIAQDIGVKVKGRGSVEGWTRAALMEIPGVEEVIHFKKGDIVYCLGKFLGPNGEPVRNILYGALERTIQGRHPEYDTKAVHTSAGGAISLLQRNGIHTKGDLEQLLRGGDAAIRALMGVNTARPRRMERYHHLVGACTSLGYLSAQGSSPTLVQQSLAATN